VIHAGTAGDGCIGVPAEASAEPALVASGLAGPPLHRTPTVENPFIAKGNPVKLRPLARHAGVPLAAVTAVVALIATTRHVPSGDHRGTAEGILAGMPAPDPPDSSTTPMAVSEMGPSQLASGLVQFTSARVQTSDDAASSLVRNLSALRGLLYVSVASAYCRHGAAESSVLGVLSGPLPAGASLARDVRTKNPDGSTSVTALVIRLHTLAQPAMTISVATATCAAARDLLPADNGVKAAPMPSAVVAGSVQQGSEQMVGAH